MRIVKEAEERKNEILDRANELFCEKGFEGTSTNDILKAVGIARGTLYYHFKSKGDIMDALIERYNKHILNAAKSAAQKLFSMVWRSSKSAARSFSSTLYTPVVLLDPVIARI